MGLNARLVSLRCQGQNPTGISNGTEEADDEKQIEEIHGTILPRSNESRMKRSRNPGENTRARRPARSGKMPASAKITGDTIEAPDGVRGLKRSSAGYCRALAHAGIEGQQLPSDPGQKLGFPFRRLTNRCNQA